MKKISKVSITSKTFRTSRCFKLLIMFLLTVLIVMSIVLIKVYIDMNSEESGKNGSAGSIITHMDKNIDEYKICMGDNELLGISDKEERIIVEPVWEEIFILSENRFIVSKTLNGEKKMGIIDCDSNIVVPFVFKNFSSISNEFVGGFTSENNDFVLFDKKANLLSGKVWTAHRFSDKIIYLNDEKNEYRGKISDDDKFRFIYLKLCREAGGIPFEFVMTEQEQIGNIGIENAGRIADIAQGYLTYLISEDKNVIKDLTTEQYLSALSSNAFFKDCSITDINVSNLEITEEKSKMLYNLKMMISYDYSKDNVTAENISSEITFNMVKDENNRIVLKSINKTEL